MIGEKSDKWVTQAILWMYLLGDPISCRDLAWCCDLRVTQMEHALKVLRHQGRADYVVARYNRRLWYLTKHYPAETLKVLA